MNRCKLRSRCRRGKQSAVFLDALFGANVAFVKILPLLETIGEADTEGIVPATLDIGLTSMLIGDTSVTANALPEPLSVSLSLDIVLSKMSSTSVKSKAGLCSRLNSSVRADIACTSRLRSRDLEREYSGFVPLRGGWASECPCEWR